MPASLAGPNQLEGARRGWSMMRTDADPDAAYVTRYKYAVLTGSGSLRQRPFMPASTGVPRLKMPTG